MQPETAQKIRIGLVLAFVVAVIASNVYMYMQLRNYSRVINNQGVVLKLMVETPEINAVLKNELQRRQASTTPVTK